MVKKPATCASVDRINSRAVKTIGGANPIWQWMDGLAWVRCVHHALYEQEGRDTAKVYPEGYQEEGKESQN